jgi:hypothetical protein
MHPDAHASTEVTQITGGKIHSSVAFFTVLMNLSC